MLQMPRLSAAVKTRSEAGDLHSCSLRQLSTFTGSPPPAKQPPVKGPLSRPPAWASAQTRGQAQVALDLIYAVVGVQLLLGLLQPWVQGSRQGFLGQPVCQHPAAAPCLQNAAGR